MLTSNSSSGDPLLTAGAGEQPDISPFHTDKPIKKYNDFETIMVLRTLLALIQLVLLVVSNPTPIQGVQFKSVHF